MSKVKSEHSGSVATTVMGLLYIAVMVFCLWSAGGERANYASACQRLGTDCARPVVRT
jgi:hypothetical protein